jgi:hypothetical protein
MKEEKKIKEFLKLENKVTLKLRIKPLSPLCIKLSCGDEENDNSYSLSAFQTTEGGKKIDKDNNSEDNSEKNIKKATELYKRDGEIYIPGSTLKGLFRDRFTTMYGTIDKDRNRFETDYIKELFGHTDEKNTENKLAQKSRFFIQDSFLDSEIPENFKKNKELKSLNFYRELFYKKEKGELYNSKFSEKIIKIRTITPVDHFSSKAKGPLQYEYTMESFSTELIINNAKLQDLQGIFFVIRDSWNQEIRIGNSKTRGFGLIKFEIEDLIYEQFKSKDDDLKKLEDFFEEKTSEEEKKLIKFNFSRKLYLKTEFKELYENDNPNKFIISLFKGGEN